MKIIYRTKQTKTKLKDAYNLETEEDIARKIQEVQKAHGKCRHWESWKVRG